MSTEGRASPGNVEVLSNGCLLGIVMNSVVLHSLVATIFVAWFVLSVINQFRFRWFDRVLALDYFSLIPYWTFFAPNPGRSDYHLVYRDQLSDGSTTSWCEADLSMPRGVLAFLWNPEKRSKKVLSDVAMSIARVVYTDPRAEGTIMISFQYLLILNYLTKCYRMSKGVARQFAIVETAGFFRQGPPSVVLRSDFHAAHADDRAAIGSQVLA
jgi:hypothetical protein